MLNKIKKYKIIDIYIYILVFCVFMGSNFLKFEVFNVKFNLARILLLIPSVIVAIDFLKNKTLDLKYKNGKIKYIVCFFCIWCVYSVLSIIRVEDFSFYIIVNYFIFTGSTNIIFFIKYLKYDSKKINIILNCIISAVFINCIYYFYLFFGLHEYYGGFYYNINDLATVLLLTIPMACWLFKKIDYLWAKIIYFTVLIVYGIAFYKIFSRGCILGICFFVFVYFVSKIISKKKSNIIFIIIGVVIFSITFINSSFPFDKYIGKISFTPVERAECSNDVRTNLVYNGLHFLFTDCNLLTGIGAGNTIEYLKNKSVYSTHNTYSFHNLLLEILVEYGVIIFIGLVIMYKNMCQQLYKNKDTRWFFLCFWVSFLVASISSSTMLTREWLWITIALTVSYINDNNSIIKNKYKVNKGIV